MQELCLSILVFRENTRREEDKLQGALRAAVAAGKVDPKLAWPEYFAKPAGDEDEAFPSADADMSGFQWEKPDQERMAAELEELMHGAHVTLIEGQPAPAAQPPPPREPPVSLRPGTPRTTLMGPNTAAELEWG